MKTSRLVSPIEMVLGLTPSIVLLAFGSLYYVVTLVVSIEALSSPNWSQPRGDMMGIFVWYSIVIAGGHLGLHALRKANRVNEISHSSEVFRLGLFAFAGMLAEATFIFGMGIVNAVALGFDLPTLFLTWALAGPTVIGVHEGICLMRLARTAEREHVDRIANE